MSYNRVYAENDIQTDRFDKTYLRTNTYSCDDREALQMIFRVRDLKQKKIIMSLTELLPIKPIPSPKQIIDYLRYQILFSIHSKNFERLREKSEDFITLMIDDVYKKFKIMDRRF